MGSRSDIHVSVVVLDGCIALPSVGALDLLNKGSQLAGPGARAFRSELVGVHGRTARAAGGIEIACPKCLDDIEQTDLVLIPALGDDLEQSLRDNAPVLPWLIRQFEGGADIASMCTGAFVLAEAGLLSGRSATTHWIAQDALRARYPDVSVQPEAFIVDEGRVLTSGGATAFMNLVLYLVEKHLGSEVAKLCSRMFLIDLERGSQQAFAIFSPQKEHGDRSVLAAQSLIESRLCGGLTVSEIAREVALSPRSLVRRFKAATGNTPLEYIQRARVESAKRQLETTTDAWTEIANAVGYEDPSSFRRIFSRYAGTTPANYRRRYARRVPPEPARA